MSAGPLLRFLLTRACLLILLAFAASSLLMLLASSAPGDEAGELAFAGASEATIAASRARELRDAPLATRYAAWVTRAVRLDLGVSSRFERPVAGLVAERAANTALLALSALVVASVTGIPLGVLAGSGRRPRLGAIIRAASVLALSMPPLILSLLLAFFAARTGLFPIGAMSSLGMDSQPLWSRASDLAVHLVLPTLALAVPIAAALERLQAEAVAGARGAHHVLAAFARGTPTPTVVWRAMWRPTLGPVVGVFGLAAGSLLSGSLAVEIVMAWPGLGRLMFEALGARDVALAAGCAAAAAAFLALWTTIGDLVAWRLDPRLNPGERP